MELKEKILQGRDNAIAEIEKSERPGEQKERMIKREQAIKEILEIVCSIQGVTPYTAIQILEQSQRIIQETVMWLKI